MNNTAISTICVLAPTDTPATEVEVCMTFLHFSVSHNMAPLGRLLVYYVRENGEGVTDSLQFSVKPTFENQVLAVQLTERRGQRLIAPGFLLLNTSRDDEFNVKFLGCSDSFSK